MNEELTRKQDQTKGKKSLEAKREKQSCPPRAKQASRRRFPAEEKIRIVMEGIRAEVSVVDLCRCKGIHPTIYYKWLKEFMVAGKGRLRGDAKREATDQQRGVGAAAGE
jgi:transposase-like protein